MKTFRIITLFSVVAVLLLSGCKEELTYNPVTNDPPTIESFTPADGPIFSQVTVRGENLNKVLRAYIGEQEVQLYRKISSQEIVLIADGTTSGKIRFVANVDNQNVDSYSQTNFTYTYVEPEISESQIPAAAEIGVGMLLMGDNMIAVQKVYTVDAANASATPVEATVLSRSMNEVLITVPWTTAASVKFFVTYYDGQSSQNGATTSATCALTANPPTISTVSPTTVDENGSVGITGTFLDRVNKVTIGGVEVPITTHTASAINVLIPIDAFPDGVNPGEQLTLEYFESAQQLNYPTTLTVKVPEVYKGSGTINGRVRTIGVFKTFYGLKMGQALENSTYGTHIDPVCVAHVTTASATTWDGLPCSAANTTNKSVVASADYYGVEPYFLVQTTSAGAVNLAGASNSNSVLRNIYSTQSGGVSVLGVTGSDKWGCGTAVVMFFNLPLDSSVPAIQSTIAAVRNGTLTKISSDNYPIDTEAKTIGGISVTTVSGALASTAWAPGITQGTTNNDLVAAGKDGVVMVIHYDYSKGYKAANPTEGIYKIGFIHVKGFSYVPSSGEASSSLITLESYWQKRPYDPVQ